MESLEEVGGADPDLIGRLHSGLSLFAQEASNCRAVQTVLSEKALGLYFGRASKRCVVPQIWVRQHETAWFNEQWR